MPALYKMDDYESCGSVKGRLENKVPDYCMINVFVHEQKKETPLFNYMKKISSNEKQSFNHGYMKRGVCFQKCIEFHESTNDTEKYKNDQSSLTGGGVSENQGLANAYNKLCSTLR